MGICLTQNIFYIISTDATSLIFVCINYLLSHRCLTLITDFHCLSGTGVCQSA